MKKGFTLFEILVASAIFAMVMVIATGVIAQMSSYNSKIKLSKSVSEETRKVADQISTDVRQAISYQTICGTVNVFSEATCPANVTQNPIGCTQKNNLIPSSDFVTASSNPSNTLIITTKDYFIIYYSHSLNKAIYRLVYTKIIPNTATFRFPCGIAINETSLLTTFQVITGNSTSYENYRLTGNDTEASVNFAGFTSGGSSALQQPYVQFYIVSKSKNYDTTTVPSQKAKAELRSMVTSRDYRN